MTRGVHWLGRLWLSMASSGPYGTAVECGEQHGLSLVFSVLDKEEELLVRVAV